MKKPFVFFCNNIMCSYLPPIDPTKKFLEALTRYPWQNNADHTLKYIKGLIQESVFVSDFCCFSHRYLEIFCWQLIIIKSWRLLFTQLFFNLKHLYMTLLPGSRISQCIAISNTKFLQACLSQCLNTHYMNRMP